jgi:hypothetical protein
VNPERRKRIFGSPPYAGLLPQTSAEEEKLLLEDDPRLLFDNYERFLYWTANATNFEPSNDPSGHLAGVFLKACEASRNWTTFRSAIANEAITVPTSNYIKWASVNLPSLDLPKDTKSMAILLLTQPLVLFEGRYVNAMSDEELGTLIGISGAAIRKRRSRNFETARSGR